MSVEKRIVTYDENVEKQMQGRVFEDYVRECMINALDTTDDASFYSIDNSEWVSKYTYKGAEHFGYKKRAFQIAILNDDSHHRVIQKSAQMGVSEIMARECICKLCKIDRTKALYTLPTDSDVGIFSDTRIKPIFEDSPSISKWARGTDNLGRKQIRNSFLIMRGSWDVRLAQMMDIDFLYLDEFDRHKPGIIGSLRARMDASVHRYETDYSTPTVKGYGINYLFADTDQKEWFVTCPVCGAEQFMTEEHILFRPDDGDRRDGYFGCLHKKCAAPLERYEGIWKPTAKGKVLMSGYHVSQAMSPSKSAQDILDTKSDAVLEQDYWNYTWGLPFSGSSDNSIDSVKYNKLYGDFTLNPKVRSGGLAIMGIDWGKPWSWAEIRTIDLEEKTSKIVWIECFKSDDPDMHSERMIDLARESEACMVVADIGYSDSRGYKLKQNLGDIFWEVASNSTGIIEPKYNRKNHHIVCFKERIIKRHFVLLNNKKIFLPSHDSIGIDFGKETRITRTAAWVKHHKNISIRKNRDGNDEMVLKEPNHLVLTSAYTDLAFEFLTRKSLKTSSSERLATSSRL